MPSRLFPILNGRRLAVSLAAAWLFAASTFAASPATATRDDLAIEAILKKADQSELDAAKALIALFPKLAPDGKLEAVTHICSLLPDADYAIVMPLFLDAKQPEDVLSTLFTDVMDRPDSVKLPALLLVARSKGHPMGKEALTTLEVFLDADFKEDWAKWEKALEKYLIAAAKK